MTTARILLVEDDEIMRVTLYDRLRKQHWQVDQAEDGKNALRMIEAEEYHLVLSDIRMPGLDGNQLLEQIVRISPGTDVIMMTAYGCADDAVDCLKKGAADYILKPFDPDDLIIRIRRLFEMRAIKARCQSLESSCRNRSPMVGSSSAFRNILHIIGQVAMSDSTVLITGESGTGKELIAAAIHEGSRRADGPYICINCAAIPEGLMESELFGHEKGAFTGATSRKIGRFEMANGGTLLLDEIGDMPLPLQAKLLRVLQEREIERVGGSRTIKVNVRVVCATSKKLNEEVAEGKFREDLLYRLQVVPIEAPPLRARKEDIPDLCDYFLEHFSVERGITFQLSDDAREALQAYDYPGNVRELRNIIERATVLAHSSMIESWNLPLDLTVIANEASSNNSFELAVVLAQAEKTCILRALRHTSGNKTAAAKLLGISRKNLWEKMKLHTITA